MATYNNQRLQQLSGGDFEMRDGEPDIRSWDVRNGQGQHLGEVAELIFDPLTCRVRHMVVDLGDDVLELCERPVLIPVGLAELDREGDEVRLPSITAEQVNALPIYQEAELDAETERSICLVLGLEPRKDL